jgi:phosphatidate cytidylyltransferase
MAAVLAGILLFLGLGAGAMALANRRLEPAQARQRWFKYGTYVLVIATEVGLAAAGLLVLLALPVALGGAWELFQVLPGSSSRRLPWLVGPLYLGLAAGLLLFTLRLPVALQVAVAVQVLVFDGFSQVTGQLLGRHALVPRLSPAKTREGLLGGLVACLAIAQLLRPLMDLGAAAALAVGAFTAVLALAGDIAASAVKRRCGVKDFSALIPGHGGVLDRFDSLLAASTGWVLLVVITRGAPVPVRG